MRGIKGIVIDASILSSSSFHLSFYNSLAVTPSQCVSLPSSPPLLWPLASSLVRKLHALALYPSPLALLLVARYDSYLVSAQIRITLLISYTSLWFLFYRTLQSPIMQQLLHSQVTSPSSWTFSFKGRSLILETRLRGSCFRGTISVPTKSSSLRILLWVLGFNVKIWPHNAYSP